MPTPIDAAIGARIRARRQELRLSLAALADRTAGEFKASVLSAYERGDRTTSAARLIRLAEHLECTVGHLIPTEHGGRPSRATVTVEGEHVATLLAPFSDTDPIPYRLTEVA